MVEVASVAVCARCAAGKGCGAGLFGAKSSPTTIQIELPSSGVFNEGDPVRLEISSKRLLHASMLAYGLPLAGALTLTFLGGLFIQPLPDIVAVALAGSGLIAGFLAGRRQLQNESCVRRFRPEIMHGSDVDWP